MKKIVFVVLAFAAAGTLFANGGGQQAAAGAGGSAKPSISVIMFDRGQAAASEGSYEDNRWTRWINENAPVNVTFVTVPRTDSTNRQVAMLSAGTAPDLLWEFGKGFMDNLYNQGVIQAVGDHINNFSTTYKTYLANHPELMPFLMAEDGKQYGMTTARNILNIPNHAMWIRQDWVEKFGMQVPATDAQVVEFMRHVRDDDPDGNGVKDSFGMTFNYNAPGIWRALFGEPLGSFKIVDGHFVDWTSTPAYRDYLAFRAMLYQEGFIDPEYITDTNFARERELLVTGKSGIHLGSWDQPLEWRDLKTNVPSANWQPFEPWTTSQGKHGLFQEPPAHYMVCMNATTQNPKDVMAYIDWMMLEPNWFTLLYGFEGQHYRLVDGVPQTIDLEKNRIEKDYSGEYAIFHQNQPQLSWFPVLSAQDPMSLAYVPIRQRANEIQLKNQYDRIAYTPTSETINRFSSETVDQLTALETAIFTGRLTVDEGLRQINAYKESFGWAAVNAEKDAWYQANKHLL